MKMPIKGLREVMNEETEDIYYFNDKMLNDGIYIVYNTLDNPDIEIGNRGCIDSYIEVKHLNRIEGITLSAEYFIMYWDSLLSNMQAYRIIKDIYGFYESYSKSEFIELIKDMSSQYSSSTIQSKQEHIDGIINDVTKEYSLVSYLAGEKV